MLLVGHVARKFASTSQKHYRIWALVPQTTMRSLSVCVAVVVIESEHACAQRSFGEETTGGVAKCRLFSRATLTPVLTHRKMVKKD